MIAERTYPLKVAAQDEAKVKEAVTLVNERIKQYQHRYGGKDKQDYMAMCLLDFAVEKSNSESSSRTNQVQLEEKLNELEQVLAV